MVYGCQQAPVKLYARVGPMTAQDHFRPRVLPEPGSVRPSGVDIRLDDDKTASVAPNASSHACWFERGGLWSGVISGRDAAQFELKTRDPPAGAIVVDSETWQGANYPAHLWRDQ
jgi:hypothetical protein